jgi:geranylgeranyl reductase family protein
MVYDVAIVGAGPAGCAAAVGAARAGLSAVLVDRAVFPRDKTCGDGLTTSALRLLDELGVATPQLTTDSSDGSVAHGYESVRQVALRSPSGRRIDLTLPTRGEFAAVISRRRLDAALLDTAMSSGVETRTGVEIDRVDVRPERVMLRTSTSNEPIEARWAIAADGHWSTVRRLVRPEPSPYLGEWHAVRQYHAAVDVDRLWVVFERDLLPGYAWVFPLPDGHANVGYGVLRSQGRSGRQLKALWPDLLARPSLRDVLGPDAHPVEPVRAWPIPTRYRPDDLAHGRVLFVGDAAAVVDPMTGEGIAQALETGMVAVACIATGGDVGGAYRAAVRRRLGHDLRFAALLAKVLARPIGARAALRAVDLTAWTRTQFARWMFEDYPRAALLTPSRWSKLRARAGAASA